MRVLTNSERRDVLVGLLCKLDELAAEVNVEYWIDGGTLLGSVRNQAVIPWDDDVDVGMLRRDFNRFAKHLRTETSLPFVLHDASSEMQLQTNFDAAKIRDSRTIGLEDGIPVSLASEFRAYSGLSIDIVPYDFLPRFGVTMFARSADAAGAAHHKLVLTPSVPKLLRRIIGSMTRLILWEIRFLSWVVSFRSTRVWPTLSGRYPRHIHPLEAIFPLEHTPLEGGSYPAPREPDAYLVVLYGRDYLIPPLRSQRRGHFSRITWNES
jgi:lipopolysaccharide cholinephosphotransferase